MGYAFVQEIEASSSAAGTSISAALPSNVVAGNLLHAVALQGLSSQSITFSDSLGNTWSARPGVSEAAIQSTLMDAHAANIAGGADTVTATFGSSAGGRAIYVLEISGLKTASVLDGSGQSTDTGNNPTNSTTCTNAAQPGVMISFGMGFQTAMTAGAGMTTRTSGLWVGYGAGGNAICQYKAITTTGAQTANFSNPTFSRQCSVASLYLEDTLPSFTGQPSDQVVAQGAAATFATTVAGATSLQWETIPPGGGAWADVTGGTGGTTDDYTTPTLSRSADAGRVWRLRATNASGTVYSNTVTAFIVEAPTSYSGIGLVVGAEQVGEGMVGGPLSVSPPVTSPAETLFFGQPF